LAVVFFAAFFAGDFFAAFFAGDFFAAFFAGDFFAAVMRVASSADVDGLLRRCEQVDGA
jgi:hypothetical protein